MCVTQLAGLPHSCGDKWKAALCRGFEFGTKAAGTKEATKDGKEAATDGKEAATNDNLCHPRAHFIGGTVMQTDHKCYNNCGQVFHYMCAQINHMCDDYNVILFYRVQKK